MTEALGRDALIALLDKLGSEQDEEVLAAARQVHAEITAAGMQWEDLLAPEDGAADEGDADVEADVNAEVAVSPAESAGRESEALALIGKLLARSGISEDLREELEGYKADIAEGEFKEADRKYLRAVDQRLSKRR